MAVTWKKIAFDADLTTHTGNTTTAHGAVSAATANKHVVRDASARAKFAAAAAVGDAIVADANVRAPDSTLLEGSSKATVQDHTPKAHTIASHSDTTATGAELETLTDGSETALHSHAAAGDVGEGHITILPHNYNSIGQGTWVIIINAAYLTNGFWRNTTSADADNISYKVYLQAGTYTLGLLILTATSQGIIDVDIDGTEVASFDAYSSPNVLNVRVTQADIAIATSGLYDLKLRIDGKNGSSSSYAMTIEAIGLWRTA